MPGRIVEDEKVPFSGGDDRCGSLIEKCLKDIRITVACLNGKELTCAGTDSTKDIETDMITVMDDARL